MKKLIVVLVMVFLFVGVAQAQAMELPKPGILPDSPLYLFKSWSEDIGTFFTWGDKAKAERLLYLAEKRLAEANAQVTKGKPEMAEKIISRYQKQLNRALTKAEAAKAKGLDIDEVLTHVSEATLKHQIVLAEVYEKVPEQAKPAIERAMQGGMEGHETALKEISDKKRAEVIGQVEQEKKEMEIKLEKFRNQGVPVPRMLIRKKVLDNISENLEDLPDVLKDESDKTGRTRLKKHEQEVKKEIIRAGKKNKIEKLENIPVKVDKPDKIKMRDEVEIEKYGGHR